MKRIITLDIIKGIAIFCVVLVHLQFLYRENPSGSHAMQMANSILGTLGVPLFLLVTGTLVLKKDFSKRENVVHFYTHNLWTILLTGEIWIAAYFLINEPFSIKELFLNLCMVHKPEVHLWYIRMIVLYYAAMPLISYLMRKSKMMLHVIVALVAGYFIYNGYRIFDGEMVPTSPGLSYGCYLLYVLGGYYILQNDILNRCKYIYIYSLCIACSMILFYTLSAQAYFLWYDNPFICLLGFSFFSLFCKWTQGATASSRNRWVTELSKMTFGIYLLHMVFIILIKEYCLDFIKGCNVDLLIYPLAFLILLCSVLVIKLVKRLNERWAYLLFRY